MSTEKDKIIEVGTPPTPTCTMTEMGRLITWLKQPSTIKALVLVCGLVGWAVEPEKIESITGVVVSVYAAIAAFYDKN